MKRKAAVQPEGSSKKRALPDEEAKSSFRSGLFDEKALQDYQKSYAESKPYLHGVIQNLIDADLLRNVRNEIHEHISFTPKETDIYKIQQSGDLANLDGLDEASLAKLPSLLKLRDAMYSSAFRKYIAQVAGSGPLSGVKRDMAINVYTPGCHLLCHDDVIGSRRLSYILYLLDPDIPWKAEWGGALRLYPTENLKNDAGEEVKVPQPDPTVVIPPAFNQLSFFTVQPGESFHDVEEVYKRAEGDNEPDGGRERMAISGWFHIPQEGEEGFEPGLEEKLAERSSLAQLQGGKADQFDQPQQKWIEYPTEKKEGEEVDLSEEDLEFLLKYLTPTYLVPDTVEELNSMFAEESSARLANFLSDKFAARLREFIEKAEKEKSMPGKNTGVARPPHKQRYLFRHSAPSSEKSSADQLTPLDELLDVLLPSLAFKKWLAAVSGLSLTKASILARRFRRGMDYTLATTYEEPQPQLELTLGITPTKGWGEDEEAEVDEDGEGQENGHANGNGKDKDAEAAAEFEHPGGYEMYMAGDDDDEDDAGSNDGVEVPANKNQGGSSMTGAGKRRTADPAVYRASENDEDDGVLFAMPAGWNTVSIVLRDTGVLRFVKYVSQAAKGDRWDITADFSVDLEEEDGQEEQAAQE